MKKTFKCEICGCETDYLYEGGEPNVCASCVPYDCNRAELFGDLGKNKEYRNRLDNLPNEHITAQKSTNGDVERGCGE